MNKSQKKNKELRKIDWKPGGGKGKGGKRDGIATFKQMSSESESKNDRRTFV